MVVPLYKVQAYHINRDLLVKIFLCFTPEEKVILDRVRDKDKSEEAEEKFRQVATAYETLKDDETR